VTNLDFITKTEESRKIINTWVEEQTNNKIKDLIPQGMITPLTRLVLTNAIYFKGTWAIQFDPTDTKKQDFRVNSEKTVQADMMSLTEEEFNYTETDDLIFDNSTQYLKDMLDEHYSESFSKCIKIKVTGDLQAQACPADDPACVPTYEIKVIDLEIIGEMSYCTDSDDGINFMIKGTTTGIQDPTTNEVVTVSDFCFSSAGGKEWVQEYYCGTTGPAAGYIVGISHECPYGCEDGACLIALEKKIILSSLSLIKL